MTTTTLRDLLHRAIRFFRMGMNAAGTISWAAYIAQQGRLGEEHFPDVVACTHRSDYIGAADVLEYRILPIVT